jgi:hypothetical protein
MIYGMSRGYSILYVCMYVGRAHTETSIGFTFTCAARRFRKAS